MRKRHAIRHLGLSNHAFKALAAELGVSRWPYRSICSVAHVHRCIRSWSAALGLAPCQPPAAAAILLPAGSSYGGGACTAVPDELLAGDDAPLTPAAAVTGSNAAGTAGRALYRLEVLLTALQTVPCDGAELPARFKALATTIVRLRFNARGGRYGDAEGSTALHGNLSISRAAVPPAVPPGAADAVAAALAAGDGDSPEPGPPPPLLLLLAALHAFLDDANTGDDCDDKQCSLAADRGTEPGCSTCSSSRTGDGAELARHGGRVLRKKRALAAQPPLAAPPVAGCTRKQRR